MIGQEKATEGQRKKKQYAQGHSISRTAAQESRLHVRYVRKISSYLREFTHFQTRLGVFKVVWL